MIQLLFIDKRINCVPGDAVGQVGGDEVAGQSGQVIVGQVFGQD